MPLEPDDAQHGAMKYDCVICNAKTSRRIKGRAVCTGCFVKGWGRLPSMPLLRQEPKIVAGTYPCSKCEKSHIYTSKIGKRHLKYRR